ncbi:MAG TPA: cellulose-binding domain-containing protein [Ktedonobacteraceae bacterium]|nr:cellulose-binding domain-containing protein [Ktedonobacteraceae bacterium]
MRKSAIKLLLAITVTLLVVGGTLFSQMALKVQAAGSACSVTYTVQNQWPGGFTASLSITNLGSTALNGWTLTFSFPSSQQITQLWNGNVSQSGASVTITNASYNGQVPAGATVNPSPGFNGSWNGNNPNPTSFSLNGTPCNGSTPTPTPTSTGPTPTPTPTSTPITPTPTPTPGGGSPEPACAPGLPPNTGTNYPTPNDPYGFGFYNQSIIGWEGNTYAPFAYLSGSFFARGVTASTYTDSAGNRYCGQMYSFGVYTYGLNGSAPPAGSVQWTMDDGYLPALTTSFTRGSVAISIKDFADKVTINGNPFELVYSRVAITNNGSSAVTVDPQPSSGLTALNSVSNTVAAGQTVDHDYVVAVDSFGSGLLLPSGSALVSAAPSLDTAYSQMTSYWNGRLAVIPTLSLPNLTLPNTGLSNPGTALDNAYKAAFVYTRIIQVGTAPYSGANNYDAVFNHDAPGILVNRFLLGDFQDAHSLLLNARASEANPYYFDGVLKTPWAWAVYLYETNDTSFVSQYFHDDASGQGPYGPSLYTMMHEIPSHLNSAGYIGVTGDNDSSGTWLFDDYSAMLGLASYKYIATRIGNTSEATWADQQLTALMNNTNAGLAANQAANNFSYLSCEVNVPDSADRCSQPTDSNWAANTFFGQDPWDLMLMGGNPSGLIGSPTQVDNTYAFGYGRLQGVLPYPTCGAFTGYSTAYNTAYAQSSFLGTKYRDLALTSYAWQIANTTNGPNAWWEAESSLSPGNPWAGSHASPEFGAIPYAWPLAGQTLALMNALVAEGFTTTSGGSSFSYTPALYLGNGIPDTWIANGQTISMSNITENYNVSSGQRATFGVSFSTSLNSSNQRVVTVTLSGTLPNGSIQIRLPAFNDIGVSQVQGGIYNASAHAVTVTPGTTTITVTLDS